MINELLAKFDAFIQNGSGYTLHIVDKLFLKLIKYRQMRGGGKLSKEIINKQACLGIECLDDRCFLYSCLAAVYPRKRNAHRTNYYVKYLYKLNTDGIAFPVRLEQISRFERLNPSLSVNVLGHEHNVIVPLYHSQRTVTKHEINLLLFNGHYYLIRHLSRLLHSQSRVRRLHFYCHFCLLSYHSRQALRNHEILCRKKLQRIETPKSSQTITFKNFRSLFYLPFIIFYDIEAVLKREGDRQLHQPISVYSITVSQHEQYTERPRIFTGDNCVALFLEHLELERRRIEDILNSVNEPIRTNAADEERYEKTTRCDICGTDLHGRRKCRDHDHLSTGSDSNLRYITCSLCNLTYGSNKSNKIPIVAHNSMAYDINHIISKLQNALNVRILAKNTERPLTLQMKGNLVFIDSLNFLSGSLDHLASKLPPDDLDEYLCWLTRRDASRMRLLLHKAALPYDFMIASDKLNVTKLPPIDAFYNKLTDTALSQEDYLRAQKIWKEFDCNILKDYMEVYVTLDVLLLAAVFENYRKSTFKHFQLDPAHYVSSPSLCFDAML